MSSERLAMAQTLMETHGSLVGAGMDKAARKTRYALGSYFEAVLEEMAQADGGRSGGTAEETEAEVLPELPLGGG